MQENANDLKELIYKALIFVPGIIIGLSAKLSKLNRDQKLNWPEALFQTAMAISTAYIAWYILDITGHSKLKAPAMVVCGRFGDEIMLWLWRYIRLTLNSIIKSK